jgi:hypothetical protein
MPLKDQIILMQEKSNLEAEKVLLVCPDLLTLRCRRQQASKQRAEDVLHKDAF